jgi:hypothetical protein
MARASLFSSRGFTTTLVALPPPPSPSPLNNDNSLNFYISSQRDFTRDSPRGFLYSLIMSLRQGYKQTTPQNIISLLLFVVVTLLVFKVWWRKMGKRFW